MASAVSAQGFTRFSSAFARAPPETSAKRPVLGHIARTLRSALHGGSRL